MKSVWLGEALVISPLLRRLFNSISLSERCHCNKQITAFYLKEYYDENRTAPLVLTARKFAPGIKKSDKMRRGGAACDD